MRAPSLHTHEWGMFPILHCPLQRGTAGLQATLMQGFNPAGTHGEAQQQWVVATRMRAIGMVLVFACMHAHMGRPHSAERASRLAAPVPCAPFVLEAEGGANVGGDVIGWGQPQRATSSPWAAVRPASWL
jgi:hypothetical protein